MRRSQFALAPLVILVFSSPALAAWSTSPSVNLPVYVGTGERTEPAILSDGAGGAFVAWADSRNSVTTGADIYAAHILKSGILDPLWPVNGYPVCTSAGDQEFPGIIADASGGMILVWQDGRGATFDIYGERLTAAGALAAGWSANGKLIGASSPGGPARHDRDPHACSDGAGGVIVAWTVEYTAGVDYDVYANRMAANGTTPAGWATSGIAVAAAGNYQDESAIAADAVGGAIIVFRDLAEGVNPQIRYRTVSSAAVVTIPTFDGVGFSSAIQGQPIGVSDGAGGMLVAWTDLRVAPDGIVINDITPAGIDGANFGTSGLLTGISLTSNTPSSIIPDGNGGAYVAWWSQGPGQPVHMTRASGNGPIAPGWTTSGVPLGYDASSALVFDGTGGVLSACSNFYYDMTGIRHLSSSDVATGWGSGAFLSDAPGFQLTPAACGDGANGMIVVWTDTRDTYRGMTGLYAQRVDRFGALGDAGPSIAGAKDTPNDQGGHMRVSWNPSYLDVEPTHGVKTYYVYRQLPTHMALARIRSGEAKLATDAQAERGTRLLRATGTAAAPYYWEQIASVPAMALPGYSFEVATAADSVPGSNPYTLFMVEATASSGAYWFSAPDSGYSVDNLPPLPPAPVAATYVTGTTKLHWSPNHESDLANYRIYRGTPLSFTPAPGNRIAAPTDTAYTDVAGSPFFYKLSAVDAHGNESAFTTVTPAGVLGVDSDLPQALAFSVTSRNPSPGFAMLRLALPGQMNVRLSIYDALGRRVRTLADGALAAGVRDLRWDGDDQAGRALPSGLYFARLEADGQSIAHRLVLQR